MHSKNVNPLHNTVENLGSKIFSAFKELHSIVHRTMCDYHAYQLEFKYNSDHKIQALQQNLLNLRNTYLNEQLKISC